MNREEENSMGPTPQRRHRQQMPTESFHGTISEKEWNVNKKLPGFSVRT
jgi:hypothetical protein